MQCKTTQTMPTNAKQCKAMQSNSKQFETMQGDAKQCNAQRCNAMQINVKHTEGTAESIAEHLAEGTAEEPKLRGPRRGIFFSGNFHTRVSLPLQNKVRTPKAKPNWGKKYHYNKHGNLYILKQYYRCTVVATLGR